MGALTWHGAVSVLWLCGVVALFQGCECSGTDPMSSTDEPHFQVAIETIEDAPQGQHCEVAVYLEDSHDPQVEIDGFEFNIAYTQAMLAFLAVENDGFCSDCDWEYFTYSQGYFGDCEIGCPYREVNVFGLAEAVLGGQPSCYSAPGRTKLFTMRFLVTDDRTVAGSFAPIRFLWNDCGDNAMSSRHGDSLLLAKSVYDSNPPRDVTDFGFIGGYPTYTGAQDSDCFAERNDHPSVRLIEFRNGGVDIASADSVDFRYGDVNWNGIANEIADVIVYSNYFLYGLEAFSADVEKQTEASDVNFDGNPLTVADMQYQIRVIIGDAPPQPAARDTVFACVRYANNVLEVIDDVDIGAAWVRVRGEVQPELLAESMELVSYFDGVYTSVLVRSLDGYSFTGEFLRFGGHVAYVELAAAQGNPVACAPWSQR